MNCKYLKQKLNRKLECKLTNRIITFKDCKECKEKEFKNDIMISNKKCTISSNCCANSDKKTSRMSVKSKKLAKMERERESLFTDDLNHCIICGKTPVNKHEIFYGKNRQNSIIYKLVIPLCTAEHHNQIGKTGIHFDKKLCDKWHVKGQKKFNEVYPDLDFVEIFKRNYLD